MQGEGEDAKPDDPGPHEVAVQGEGKDVPPGDPGPHVQREGQEGVPPDYPVPQGGGGKLPPSEEA